MRISMAHHIRLAASTSQLGCVSDPANSNFNEKRDGTEAIYDGANRRACSGSGARATIDAIWRDFAILTRGYYRCGREHGGLRVYRVKNGTRKANGFKNAR